MTTLVTGASGFLGGHLARTLCRRGEPVRVLVRRSSSLSALEGLPLQVVYGALEAPESLHAAVRGVQTIYHCAAFSSDWGPWAAYHAANVLGVQNLLQAACRCGTLERFVHVSTTDVYGYPIRPCDETASLRDVGLPYNRSKVLGEQAVWEAYRQHGLPITLFRPGNIYGAGSKDFVLEIASQLRQGWMPVVNGGNFSAGLLYVENGVESMLHAVALPQSIGQAYNLLDGAGATWRAYVDMLADGLGVKRTRLNLPFGVAYAAAALNEGLCHLLHIRARPLLTRHAVYLLGRDQNFSIVKAQQELGYSPAVSFEEGMARSIAWVRSLS